MRLRARVARSSSRVRKLCTGQPAAVRLRRALSCARGETRAGATTEVRVASALARSSSSNSNGVSALAHRPFHVVREHTQQDMRTHPVGGVVEDGPDLQIHGLEATEGALDLAQTLVGGHRPRGIELARGHLVRTMYRPSRAASRVMASSLRR